MTMVWLIRVPDAIMCGIISREAGGSAAVIGWRRVTCRQVAPGFQLVESGQGDASELLIQRGQVHVSSGLC